MFDYWMELETWWKFLSDLIPFLSKEKDQFLSKANYTATILSSIDVCWDMSMYRSHVNFYVLRIIPFGMKPDTSEIFL